VEIFTNAPSSLDYEGSEHFGQMGMLRIVSVGGTRKMAEAQLRRYKERGFFATTRRIDASAFVSQSETQELSS
jgi:hypothetical protein